MASVPLAAGVLVSSPPESAGTPVEFGIRNLNQSLAPISDDIQIRVFTVSDAADATANAAIKSLPEKAESFAIARSGKDIVIVGRDATGAMYGCLELAERIEMNGAKALNIRKPIVQSPAVEFRAINPFLTVPYNETDENWYFLQTDYWERYLDQLARARINWIDLHGMYDIRSTGFPNLYPYFVASEQFPDVGVGPEIAARNLAMLNKIIAMAKARGIKVALMSYSAGWKGTGRTPTSEPTSENLAAYTREAVRKMIDSCPDLAWIGFRIGESGQKEDFFLKSYIPAIEEASRQIPLYTRTWITKKDRVLAIGRQFPGRFYAEIKYNGEQFGPPYIVAGGRMQGWHDYSYREYYSYPRSYDILYQLRANGTHRVFYWGNPLWAARANESSTLAGSIGLCVEPMDAYYPKYDYRHRVDSPNRWFKWQCERDWYWYDVWGRTGYDPSLGRSDKLWKHLLAKRFGKAAAGDLYEALKWASMIVPDYYTSYCLGPDHRHMAVELEWGGDVKAWAEGKPLDGQNIQSPAEYAQSLITNRPSARANPITMAAYVAQEARETRKFVQRARARMKTPTPEFNDLTTELEMLADLGDYFSHKMIAAAHFAVMTAWKDVSLEPAIRKELGSAAEAWGKLAATGDTHYKPFIDTLRMHTEEYSWTKEGEKLPQDLVALDKAVTDIRASGGQGNAPAVQVGLPKPGPQIASCKSSVTDAGEAMKKLTVSVRFKPGAEPQQVFLKTKPFPSDKGPWVLTPMAKRLNAWTSEANVQPEGLMWCIEALDAKGNGTLWPGFRRETPYKYVGPWEVK